MASNINPNNINGNYPVAGQDNDSQGFRDNFTNIKTNLAFSKLELEDLQSKVVLKTALTGTTLSNDFNNSVMFRPQLKAASVTFNDLGPIYGLVTLSFLDGGVQKLTSAGTITLGLSDFPAAGTYGSIRVWLSIASVEHTVLLPTSVSLGLGSITGLTDKTITFPAVGEYMFEFATTDAGQSFWIIKLA